MTEPQQTASNINGSSRTNLGMMVAAAAHIADGDAPAAYSRRPKLVLPELTDAMRVDLALTKRSSASAKASTPLSIGARPEYTDYALRDIATPHPNDVLCGRGGGSNKHPGNESFRELVSEVKFPYVNLSKREKPLVARRIVEAVRNQTPPGRFLSKDPGTGLWNDIGDGKAREKTSQALREGAPIIREHMSGKQPSSPVHAATVLKEAKRVERAEKERDARLPGKSPEGEAAKAPVAHRGNARASPVQSKNEPMLIQRGANARISNLGNNGLQDLGMRHGGQIPPLKKFRSFPGEQELNNGPPPPAAWPPMQYQHQQRGRNFNMMPYGHHPGHTMGGFAPPHLGPAEYPGGRGVPRYPNADSVPFETVRRLLLGQLDPVRLALQILPPDEAAAVFRRHNRSPAGPPHHPGNMVGRSMPPVLTSPGGAPPHPPKLLPIVSDDVSSASTAGVAERRLASSSDQSPTPDRSPDGVGGGRSDDGSSVESARRSDTSEGALPKKKRKYVET